MNIAALISGGVDSAVAVHLLCEQGYKPDLFYIKIGMDTDDGLTCTAEEDIELASATARKYGLSFHIVDLVEEGRHVLVVIVAQHNARVLERHGEIAVETSIWHHHDRDGIDTAGLSRHNNRILNDSNC
jgi:asparagine synthetase B (glutamine-hydrolysing)